MAITLKHVVPLLATCGVILISLVLWLSSRDVTVLPGTLCPPCQQQLLAQQSGEPTRVGFSDDEDESSSDHPNNTTKKPMPPGTVTIRRASEGTGIAGVDAVVVINREPRMDRRLRTEFVMRVGGITNAQFVRATESHELERAWRVNASLFVSPTNMQLEDTAPHVNRDGISWATVACRQSHVRVLRAISQSDLTVLVLEDDVDIEEDFAARLGPLVAQLPADWQMLRVGNCWEGQSADRLVSPGIYQTRIHTCSHAYLVRGRRGAAQWLRVLDIPDSSQPLDVITDKLLLVDNRAIPGYRPYTLVPVLAVQVPNSGDIPSSGMKDGGKVLVNPARRRIAALMTGFFRK